MRYSVRRYVLFVCLAVGLPVISLAAHEPSWMPPTAEAVAQALDGLTFDAFVEQSYELYMLRNPEDVTAAGAASLLGVRNDLLRELSEAYLAETRAVETTILSTLQRFDRAILDKEQQLLYDVCLWYWSDLNAQHEFSYPIDFFLYPSYPSILVDSLRLHHPLLTIENVEDYLCKLEQIDGQLDQIASELDRYAEVGIIPSRGHLAWARSDLLQILQHTEYSSPFYTTLRDKIDAIPELDAEAQRDYLREAATIIRSEVNPAYRRFSSALRKFMDAAPSEGGLTHVPQGEAFYTYCLEHFLQTSQSAEELHSFGLTEVAKAEAALREAAAEWGISRSLSTPEIIAAAAELGGSLEGAEILRRYRELVANGKARSSNLVGDLPQAEILIVPHDEGDMYFDAAADGSTLAVFYATASGVQPAYRLPIVAFHETYPGHHLQHAIASASGCPLLLRKSLIGRYQVGFIEGWGFYTEMLTSELGWYDDISCASIAVAQYDLLRSMAVVVNTGLHALGWSEEQAMQYYMDTLGVSERSAERYVYGAHLGLPAHYLDYKVGGTTIRALRARARDALGEAFSLSEFHDALLEHGALPLHILESVVDSYIEAKQEL